MSQTPATETGSARKSRRKGAGRAGRLEKRTAAGPAKAVWPGVTGGHLNPLSHGDMEKTHHGALEILATVGIADATEELLEVAEPFGCHLNEHGRLCFPKALIEDVIAGAAREYTVFARGDRAGKDDIHSAGNKVHFSISGTAVTTFEAESETYRASNLLDIYDFTRLTDSLDNIHMAGVSVVATEIEDDFEHDMNIAYALLSGTEKPMCMSFRSAEFIKHGIEMFDIALGGEGRFVKNPFIIFGGCPIVSPLKFGKENLEVLMETSRLGLTSDIAVAPQSGATAPAPLAGILAQVIAETLACLAVVNMVKKGCPMAFAAWPFITDLRTGSFTGGSGEQAILAAAAVQMGNFYDLPNSIPAGMTDAKTPDAQHGFEKGISLALAAHAGANRVCEAAGMMGSLMGCSFEAMVLDNEAIGMVLRTIRGIEVNDETLSIDVIKSCAIDPGHYLGNDQTLKFMENEYLYPTMMDRLPAATWEAGGSEHIFERAKEQARDILSSHYPSYLSNTADKAIRDKFPIRIATDEMHAGNPRWQPR